MTDKHTPGPWTVVNSPKGVPFQIEAQNGFRKNEHLKGITSFNSICSPTSPEGQANARLMAAAPDLLAACVQAYGDLIEGREVDIEKLDRAIAKAEGRS